jgi:integrase
MTRKAIEKYGRYGQTVNVFATTLNDEAVARVEWRELGQRKTKTFHGAKRDREAAAKAYAEGVLERLKGGDVAAPKRYTVGELWGAYLTAHAPDWRPKTLMLAKARWKEFGIHVNPHTWADLVQPETLDSWRLALLSTTRVKTNTTMARNQVAHHIQLVKSVWRFARQRKLIADNPLVDYAVKKGRDYGALEVPEYTPAEWGRILAQLDFRDSRRWRPWAAIALDGMLAPRSRALLQLTWDDVDLEKRAIRWPGETDKLGRVRVQPLPRDAVFVLRVCRVWARRQGYTGPYVFYGVQARTKTSTWTYAALNKQLHDAADRADVKRVKYRAMHSLRRMAGGNVLAATGDITKVGDWLGDTDMRVLRKSYLRARPDGLATVVATTHLPQRIKQTAKSGNKTATDAVGASVEDTANR